MLREQFIGRNPTHFVANPIVKAFITSELFLWSAFNAVIPLLGIFVVQTIPGGNIQLAASGYSIHLISRVVFELISGKKLSRTTDRNKMHIAIYGLIFTSIGTFGFALTHSLWMFFTSFIILGIGLGIASPAKNSLFSTHLDKNKEAAEWSIYDGVVFICIALATSLGGFIASVYGFGPFFLVAGGWILIGTVPYLLYIRGRTHSSAS